MHAFELVKRGGKCYLEKGKNALICRYETVC